MTKYGGFALTEVKAMPPNEALYWLEQIRETVQREADQTEK